MRNLVTSFQPTDPPYFVYSAQLSLISLLTAPQPAHNPTTNSKFVLKTLPSTPPALSSPGQNKSPQDIHAALNTLQTMETLSIQHGHNHITLLALVLRLRILVAAAMWGDVPTVLQRAETALGLSYDASTTPRPGTSTPKGKARAQEPEATFITFEDPVEAALVVHLLMMSITYYTHIGVAAETSPRLSHLHALLDSGVLDKFKDGIVHVGLYITVCLLRR